MFNEIIEINFCGLSKYTKKNIIQRAISEENKLIIRNETIETIEADQYQIKLKEMPFVENDEDEKKSEQTN